MTTTIKYDLQMPDGRREILDVAYDTETLRLEMPLPAELPAWTALDFHRCRNCPLSADSHSHCPLAARLIDIAERFGDTPSFEEVTLHVRTEARVISARTTAQAALGSLMGLIMPLSGCPRLAPLAPMARFHLPLSTHEETIYRVASMYLLSQYFRDREIATMDSDLIGLSDIYTDIQAVNQGLAQRLRNSAVFDEINSVALLDLYAQMVPLVIEDCLEDIRHLFTDIREVA